MPFIVSHNPSFAAVGSVALQTGNAQYVDRLRRDREAMAFDEMQRRRSIYASLVSQGMQIRASRERQLLDQDFAREQIVRRENFQQRMFEAEEVAAKARLEQQQQAQALFRRDDREFEERMLKQQQAAVAARHREDLARQDQEIAIRRQQAADLALQRDLGVASELFQQEQETYLQVQEMRRQGWGYADGGREFDAWIANRKKILNDPTLRGRTRAEALLMHSRQMPWPDQEPAPDPAEIVASQVQWIEDEVSGARFPVMVKPDRDGNMVVEFPTGWNSGGKDDTDKTRLEYQKMAKELLMPGGLAAKPPTADDINRLAGELAGRQNNEGQPSTPGQPAPVYAQPKMPPLNLREPIPLTQDLLQDTSKLKAGAVYGPFLDPELGVEVLYQWNGKDFDRIAPWEE